MYQNIPNDPVMLLSFVNTQLRDYFTTLDLFCEVDMDEDDAARLMQGHYKECPYYQNDDEYAVVRHQM